MKLAEQLTVCLLVGILGAIAVPSFTGFVAAQELRVDADQVKLFLEGAKSEAKKQSVIQESALAECPTDNSCLQHLVAMEQFEMCANIAHSLLEVPEALSQYKAQESFAIFEDGSCSQVSIIGANLIPLVPSVSVTSELLSNKELSSLRSWAHNVLKSAKTASGTEKPISRGEGRRENKAEKKPAKNKLVVEGCFRLNGQFLLKVASGYSEVNWSSLPANTTINTKSPLCPSVNVN